MQTKLTLRMDEQLIRRAKHYASRTGKSVSKMVADYLNLLDQTTTDREEPLTPRVAALLGLIEGTKVDEKDYRDHLIEKYS